MSSITLNINRLNVSVKRQRLSDCIKKPPYANVKYIKIEDYSKMTVKWCKNYIKQMYTKRKHPYYQSRSYDKSTTRDIKVLNDNSTRTILQF